MRRITSRQNPLVARFRAAARGEIGDVILLDGAHLVADALAAGVRIHEAVVAAAAVEDPDVRPLLHRLVGAGVDPAAALAPVMAAISPVRSPSAIVALAERPASAVRRQPITVPLIVAAVDVQDPGNVGALVRVAEAGGATAAVIAGASADPFGWKALRGSMGSGLRLPIDVLTGADSPVELVAHLRSQSCRIVATVPRGGLTLFDTNLTGPVAVLVGGEGHGLPPSVLDAADERVSIPMQPPVESLNTAVTAAILIYEAFRQRTRPAASQHLRTSAP